MQIEFTTEQFVHSVSTRAIHASNGAIIGQGKNKAWALVDILDAVRRSFINIGEPLNADTLKTAMDKIERRLVR